MVRGERTATTGLEELERLAGIGAFVWEVGPNQIEVSDGLREMLGVEAGTERFTFEEILALIDPADRAEAMESLARAATGVGPEHALARIRRPDGQPRHLEGQLEAILGEDGTPVAFRGVVQDVTERFRVQQQLHAGYAVTRALAESESVAEAIEGALAALAESTGWEAAGLWLVDESAGVLRCHGLWHVPTLDFAAFAAKTRELTFVRGKGVPGVTWEKARPFWRDVVPDDDVIAFPRSAIGHSAGLAGVLAFPVLSRGAVTGVIDLWRRPSGRPPDDLIALLASFGSQIGQFLERKRAETELLEHRRLLAETQRLAKLGSWEWRPGGEKVLATGEFSTLLGLGAASEPLLDEVFSVLVPEDGAALRTAIDRCARKGLEFGYVTTRLSRPAGAVAVVEWFGERDVDAEGNSIIRGTTQDITPEHALQSELATRARQQAAVAAFGSEALAKPDLDSLMTSAVTTVADILGIRHAAVMELLSGGAQLLLRSGVGWEARMVGEFTVPAGAHSHSGYVLERGAPVVSEDLSRETRFNVPRALIEHGAVSCAAVVIAAEGGSYGTLGAYATELRRFSADDVSFLQGIANVLAAAFRAERAAELERQLQQAQRLDSVGKLAGGIAHDFNNLLAVILNYADFALETAGGAARGEIEEIRRAAERAAELTRQLLLFSRREVTSPEVIDVGATILGMETILRRTLGEHLRLDIAIAPGLWPVQLASSLLEQIVLNLVINARDAMPEGGGIEISAVNVAPEPNPRPPALPKPGHVRISVRDTGIGMSHDVLDRAFEPFFTTKPEGKGTGLGLATVYGIVQRAGGEVEIESRPGGGTTVAIFVPAAIAEDAAPEPAEGELHERPGGSETILLVEDEEAVRRLTRRILEGAGYAVLDASGPDAAMAIWRDRGAEVDLLLTDVVMPGRSGIRLREDLAGDRPDLRVIFMSGYSDDAVSHAGALGPHGAFLRKPFISEELLAAVREALSG